jgi:hypothetical protein
MSWTNSGSLAATNGNKNFVGTGTLMLGAFVDDALLYTNGTTIWMSDIASITDNTHLATVDNWPFSSGTVANGNWYIVPCSPLRQTTATLNNQLSTLIAGFAAIFNITASDNYGTLNKAASANNAGLYLTTAGSAVARIGTFGDDNLRMGPAAGGGGYTDAIVIDKTTALVSVYADPTAALGIATKQYVDGTSKTKVVRAAHNAGNITISSPGSTIGGVTPANGERYLLAAQTTGAQNGIYVYNGSSSAMTRVTDAAAAAQLPSGCLIAVSEGTHANRVFILATAAPLVVGTTALTFTRLDVIELASPSLTGPTTVTSNSANAFAVGANGATNPMLNLDASTASVATGLNIKGAAAAGGLALSVLSSGTNEALTIDAKGNGTITLGGTSTGAITLSRATTLSAALTYGGVTLTNAVTGTGKMVLDTAAQHSSLGIGIAASANQALVVNGAVHFGTSVYTGVGGYPLDVRQGVASDYTSLFYNNDTSGTQQGGILIILTKAGSAANNILTGQQNGGTTCVNIQGNGNIVNTNNSYGAISDRKLKDGITLAHSQWDDMKAIGKIVSKFYLKADPEKRMMLGLVAQDLQAISPGLVGSSPDIKMVSVQARGPDGELLFDEDDKTPLMREVRQPTGTETLHVNYSILYMKAVKALGEALVRIEVLESRAA